MTYFYAYGSLEDHCSNRTIWPSISIIDSEIQRTYNYNNPSYYEMFIYFNEVHFIHNNFKNIYYFNDSS